MRILTTNNPEDTKILTSVSKPVDVDALETKETIHNLEVTFKEYGNAIGLAANQIGDLKRIFIMDRYRKGNFKVFINPTVIIKCGGTYETVETCLSSPGTNRKVTRHKIITIKWYDEHGIKHSKRFGGKEAQIIQHEMDHFDGVLI